MQEFDPLGIGSYMRSRMRELIGPEMMGTELYDVPRFALGEGPKSKSLLEETQMIPEMASLYINPEVEWAFPEGISSERGPQGTKARGHRPIIGGGVGTEILESTNAHPARPPRRLFRVDVTENGEFYFLRADLAGMHKENVKIAVQPDQNMVVISVEPPKDDFFGLYKSPLESVQLTQKQESPEKENLPSKESSESSSMKGPEISSMKESEISSRKEVCHLIERCTQSMKRSLKMPKAVNMSKVQAEMRDGLLVIKFAKKELTQAEENKMHEIDIKG